MYALFETEFGVRMVRAEEKIRAVAADKASAAPARRGRWASPCSAWSAPPIPTTTCPWNCAAGLYRTDTHHYKNDLS
jgi:GntR family transcriptional regulator